MSSENFSIKDKDAYTWNNNLNPDDYLFVTYYAESSLPSFTTALGIAKEQTATNIRIMNNPEFYGIRKFTARLVDLKDLNTTSTKILDQYWLKSNSYEIGTSKHSIYTAFKFILAFPISIFSFDLSCIWNAISGEIFRVGYINTIKLIDIKFPESFNQGVKGPKFGVTGLRDLLNVYNRPLLCRSTRPAVGLNTKEMVDIARKVLMGGFDIIKDDELTNNIHISPLKRRAREMKKMINEVEDATGERKLYFCNITSSPKDAMYLAETALKEGADGFLVCPGIQGIEICKDLQANFGCPILCHNSGLDVLSRHPLYGITYEVVNQFMRISGADLIMMPGHFSTPALGKEEMTNLIKSVNNDQLVMKKAMPILAGGKIASELGKYINHVGTTDFMLIIATSVDNHTKGIQEGARMFREACNSI